MASGKKNYFRHSFFARNDMKLRLLRDSVGVGFYFYFFTLLELCGESSEDKLMPFYEFHDSQIRSLWGVNLKKSERIACVMHSVGLLEFEKRGKSFWFNIPNLPKYLGKYTNKNTSNGPNKIKENKRKEKKEENTAFDKLEFSKKVLTHLNNKTGKNFKIDTKSNINLIAKLKAPFSDFEKVINSKTAEWQNTDMSKFLRPSTLFKPCNFENYLNEMPITKNEKSDYPTDEEINCLFLEGN